MAAHNPKLLFLTSPNNPDGSMLAEEDLLRLLALPMAEEAAKQHRIRISSVFIVCDIL